MKNYIAIMINKLCQKTKNLFTEKTRLEPLKEPVIEQQENPLSVHIQHPSSNEDTIDKLLTITEAAKAIKVTRQAIYSAINSKRLIAKRQDDRWWISSKDLDLYRHNKYSRSNSRRDGELIFDKQKGFYSTCEVGKILRKNANQVYYLIRVGKIKTIREGGNIIIKDTDLKEFIDKHYKKPTHKIAI